MEVGYFGCKHWTTVRRRVVHAEDTGPEIAIMSRSFTAASRANLQGLEGAESWGKFRQTSLPEQG